MLSSLSPYIAPLLVFGLVVFVHELGHFLAAKLTGVYAPVFSLGWGRRLFGVRRGETDYRVSIIPLGGYVRMASREDEAMAGIEGGGDRGTLEASAARSPERPADVSPALWDAESMAPFGPKLLPADRWVENKSTSARVLILSAGVIMNILLTLVVSSSIYYRYGNSFVPAVVDSVIAGAPAARAGVVSGDRIVAIDGDSVRAWDQVLDHVAPVTSGTLTVEIERAGARLTKVITPQVAIIDDPVSGAKKTVGRIGIQVRDSVAHEAVGALEAMSSGAQATWRMAASVGSVLSGLFSGEVSAKNLGGPIQIARTSVQAAKSGPETLWSLIAFLSLNIAILNLVPIPVLDGGHMVFLIYEKIRGKPMPESVMIVAMYIGLAMILSLMVFVIFLDVRRLFF